MLPLIAELTGSVQVAAAAIGATIGVGLVGAKAAEAVGRNPGAATPVLVQSLIGMALAEGIFFVAFFLK